VRGLGGVGRGRDIRHGKLTHASEWANEPRYALKACSGILPIWDTGTWERSRHSAAANSPRSHTDRGGTMSEATSSRSSGWPYAIPIRPMYSPAYHHFSPVPPGRANRAGDGRGAVNNSPYGPRE
jgi:hypothetical protein